MNLLFRVSIILLLSSCFPWKARTGEVSVASKITKVKIQGAYGYALGEKLDSEAGCSADSSCGDDQLGLPLFLNYNLQGCKVKARETIPDEWIFTVCLTPKSKKIFKIIVEATGLDETGELALKEKLQEKYGPGNLNRFDGKANEEAQAQQKKILEVTEGRLPVELTNYVEGAMNFSNAIMEATADLVFSDGTNNLTVRRRGLLELQYKSEPLVNTVLSELREIEVEDKARAKENINVKNL